MHELNNEITPSNIKKRRYGKNVAVNSGIIILNIGLHPAVSFQNDKILELLGAQHAEVQNVFLQTDLLGFFNHYGDFLQSNDDELAKTIQGRLNDRVNRSGRIFTSQLRLRNGNCVSVTVEFAGEESIAIYLTDVSEIVREDETLEMVLDKCASGYWVFNTNNDSLHFESRYLTRILTEEERAIFRSQGLWPFFHKDDIETAKELWYNVVKKGIVQEGLIRMITQNAGVRWFRFNITPHFSKDGELRDTLALFTDVTKTVKQEEALRKEKETVEASLKARNDFLARLSHEVRTPMNAVIGIADLVVQRNENEQLVSKLELIQTASNNVLSILDSMLSHARLGSDVFTLTPTEANPSDIVKNTCNLWQARAAMTGIALRCAVDGNVPHTILFDAHRYEQCLNNLLSNAIKFTKQGQIDVVLTAVGSSETGQKLLLAVRDTGIGMTPEQQSRIFSAYTQADSSISKEFGGTGLGMNITKEIIDRMDGEISVKSQLGKGTLFAITIPVRSERVVVAAPESPANIEIINTHMTAPTEPIKPKHSDLKILVVDDNATNHMVIKSLIGDQIGEIYNANNGQEALDVLEVTDVDIVLMDIHMPTMDGIEATIAIRNSDKPWNDVLIIALTADPQYQQKKICINIGMDDALAKPVKVNDIFGAIDNVLNMKLEREQNIGEFAASA